MTKSLSLPTLALLLQSQKSGENGLSPDQYVAGNKYQQAQLQANQYRADIGNSGIAGVGGGLSDIGSAVASVISQRRADRELESLAEVFRAKEEAEATRKQNLVNTYPEDQRGIAANLPINMIEKDVATRLKPVSEEDKLDLETKRLNLRKGQIDLQKSMRELNDPNSGLSPKDKFDQAYKLRDKYTDLSKNYITSADAFTRVKSSAKDPSPAGDLSLIYSYMKLLDPGSVVRESEFGLAETARPALEKAGISWDRVKSIWKGERLTTDQRTDFVARAGTIFRGATKDQDKIKNQYSKLAQNYGIKPEEVVLDYSGTSSPDDQPPITSGKVGNVGWRIK